ncbi:MAG: hypothetical protein EOO92_24090, partial [Pedobacter sp.]
MQHANLKLLAEYGKRVKELNVYGALPEGYYLIGEVAVTTFNGYSNVHANAMWHPKNKEVKQTNYPVSVNLSGLYNRISFGPKEFNPNCLNGVTIQVKSCTIHEYEYD